ncbi:ABC transporter ATP-binding protein [Bordetella genomosp. 9]|nr:ATP-binding cassette domain-containing protein [Bordetella genomosp. 9]
MSAFATMPHTSSDPLPAGLVLKNVSTRTLTGVDLQVAPGECVAIMGPSGAGKSLLLRQIADLDPGTGEVWLDGKARRDMPAPAWRRKVAYCQAEAGWWDDRVAPHFPAGAANAGIDALMARLGLDAHLLSAQVHELSTGERQRMALVRALANDPAVLLMDEPTAALDADATARVETEILARLGEGRIAIIATHAREQARRLARRTLLIRDGRLEAAP